MTDMIEYIPKRHGQKPDYWTPDTLTGLDGKNYVRQPNWAWIAGTTYYVPYEAVHGMSRDVDELLTDGAGTLDDYQRGALEERAKIVAWLRELPDAVVKAAIDRANAMARQTTEGAFRIVAAALADALQETER